MRKIVSLFCLFLSVFSFAQKTELVIRSGHAGGLQDFIISPDKKWMATAGEDGSVILWDTRKQLQVKQFQLRKKGMIQSVAFSPDSKLLAAAGDDIVAVIDVASTNILTTFSIENKNTAVAFTPDGNYMVSVGWQGFVTVWRSDGLKQVMQFNPYEGMYDAKYKYFAYLRGLSISSDGKRMALGDDTYGLVEFKIPEEESGWNDIVKTRTAQDIKVQKLTYTGDGKYLVVLTKDNALITLNGTTYTKLAGLESKSYETEYKWFSLAGSDNFIYVRSGLEKIIKMAVPSLAVSKTVTDTTGIQQVLISPAGNEVYASKGSGVYRYVNDGFTKAVAQFSGATNFNEFVSVSADGKMIAINNADGVIIYNVTLSRIIKRLQLTGSFFSFSYPLQFDKTGTFLYINEGQIITQWSVATWNKVRNFNHNNHITSFSVSYDGKYLATTDDQNYKPSLKVWNTATGALATTQTVTSGLAACAFSNDGKLVATIGGSQALSVYSVPSFTKLFMANESVVGENLLFTPDGNSIYTFDRNAIYKTSVSDNNTTQVHSEGGAPSKFSFPVTTLAASPDGQSFVMKGDGTSVMHNSMATGVPYARLTEQSGMVTSVSYSGDGNYYVTSGEDGQIILRNSRDSMLCSLFSIRGKPDWIVVMPDGRFDASVEALNDMYFHKATDILPLSSLFETFYTPHLLPRLLAGERFARLDVDISDVKQKPLVKISYAEKQRNLEVSDDVPSYTNTTGMAEITVNASAQDDAVDEIRLFHNGKVLNLATRNLIVEDDKSKTATKTYTVNLLPGTNEIRAIALNTQRTESEPDVINVVYNNGAPANTNDKPVNNGKATVILDKVDKNATLHLVVVGINAYQNPKMSLNYALADATAFKEEVEKDAKSVISNVKTYFVTDAQADKNGISAAFAQVQQSAKPQDVFLFYYAGHGVIAEGNKEFYLVPNDVADLHNVDAALQEHGIAAKDLQQYAVNIQAQKQLFILDACQSAGAFADLLSADGNQQKNIAVLAKSTGTHWMAASGAQQYANEFSTLGHGAFTYVLLQALKGEAASNKMITVDGLKTFMQNGVPALMKKYNGSQQTPASYGFGNDFPVEVIK